MEWWKSVTNRQISVAPRRGVAIGRVGLKGWPLMTQRPSRYWNRKARICRVLLGSG